MKELLCDIWEIYCKQYRSIICITTNSTIRNGQAVMGKGVALRAKQIRPGLPRLWATHLRETGNHVTLLNEGLVAFPVKAEVWYKARLDLIQRSLAELDVMRWERGWTKVYLPRPGCGAGGLDWEKVKPYCEQYGDWLIVVDRPRKEQKE